MKARELFLDFLNLVFLISLTVFSLVYFVLGDRIDLVIEIMKGLIPLSFFGLMVAFKLRMNEKRREKREREGNLKMELWFTYGDKAKSEYFLYSLPLVVMFIPIIWIQEVNIFDILQALTVLGLCYWWQRFLFVTKGSRDKGGVTVEMTYADKIKGDVLIFSLPFIIILIPFASFSSVDGLDLAQAIAVFIISALWQQFLLSKEV